MIVQEIDGTLSRSGVMLNIQGLTYGDHLLDILLLDTTSAQAHRIENDTRVPRLGDDVFKTPFIFHYATVQIHAPAPPKPTYRPTSDPLKSTSNNK